MIAYDLIVSLPFSDILVFLWFFVLLDVPRYLLASVVMVWLRPADRPVYADVTGIIACHNEQHTIRRCVESMRRNGVAQICVVNDGSTDRTHEVAAALAGVELIDLPERIGKPDAINAALPHARHELILVADADTVFADGSVPLAAGYFDGNVGGVGFYLRPLNASMTLTTSIQAVEYAIGFGSIRRLTDLIGLLPNVSGAASMFSKQAIAEVKGWDCEVAEDAAISMKLRAAGWQVRYAADAEAMTIVPETMDELFLQRLRWDACVIAIWWRKFGWMLNPFSRRFRLPNALTVLDVLLFSAIMPVVLPVYLFWMFDRAGAGLADILMASILAMAAVELFIAILVGLEPWLLIWWPWYFVVELFALRPLRVIALVSEALFKISRNDPYIPVEQRWRLI